MHRLFPFSILFLTYMTFVNGQTLDEANALMEALLTGYNKDIRPSVNLSRPVLINATFDLVSVRELDEILGKLSVVGILCMSWHDPRMEWNPFLYGGQYMVNIPMEKVWKPDLVVGHPIDSMLGLGYFHKWINVRYFYNGVGTFCPGDVISTTCAIDVRYYPFDVQKCDILFLPWGMFGNEMYFISTEDKVLKNFFSENGEWQLEETHASSGLIYETYSYFEITLHLRRRPTFVIVNVILPIMFMGFLNVLVFILPAQSGERVSFAITVLLAIAVFLTLVNDNLPKTSQPMSTICYFLLTNLVMSSLIMLATILNLQIHHKPASTPIPDWLRTMVISLRGLCGRRKTTNTNTRVEEIDLTNFENNIVQTVQPTTKNGLKSQPTLNKRTHIFTVNSNRTTKGDAMQNTPPMKQVEDDFGAEGQSDSGDDGVTWTDVGTMIDHLAFALSTAWLFVSSMAFFIMVALKTVP